MPKKPTARTPILNRPQATAKGDGVAASAAVIGESKSSALRGNITSFEGPIF